MSSIGILFSFPDNNSFWGSVTSRGSGDYDVGADARSKFREKSDHSRRSGSSQAAVNPNSSNIFTQQNYQHNRSYHLPLFLLGLVSLKQFWFTGT